MACSGDGGAVGGVEIDQDECEVRGEVDACMGFANRVVIEFVFVIMVTAEEELALLLQEVLVNRLFLLYYNQRDHCS